MEPSSQNAQTAHTGSSEILHIQEQPFHLPASHPQEGTLHHATVHVRSRSAARLPRQSIHQ